MEFSDGTPCWMQVNFNDLDSGTEFFRRTAGWEIPPGDPDLDGYALASVSGQPISGVWPIPAKESQPDGIDVWLKVSNIEDALERMRQHGAEVQTFDGEEILTVMTLGKQALLIDPFGAWIGLWEPITFPGISIMMVPGSPFWFEHMSPDPAAAAQFYADCFSLDVVNHGDEYWTIQVPGSGSDAYGFSFPRTPEDTRGTWFVSLLTSDLDRTAALVKENGGTVVEEFTEMEDMGRFTYAATPAGVAYGLWEADLSDMEQ